MDGWRHHAGLHANVFKSARMTNGAFSKFLGLSLQQKSAILRSTVLLAGSRIALAFIPVSNLIGNPPSAPDGHWLSGQASCDLWAISAVGQKLSCSCLCQSIAAIWSLRLHGFHGTVVFGSAKVGGEFKAHAWVENSSGIVFGDPRSAQYVRFPQYS